LVVAGVAFELEKGAGGEAAGGGLALEQFVLGLEFVEAHGGQAVAFVLGDVFAGEIEDFIVGFAVGAGQIGFGQEGGFGFLEIEIGEGVFDGWSSFPGSSR